MRITLSKTYTDIALLKILQKISIKNASGSK